MNSERLKWVLLVLVSFSGLWLLFRLIPPIPIGQKIAMTIIKQKGKISNLNTPRNPDFVRHFRVDTIRFKEGKVFEHPKWGSYGFQNDFFVEFEVNFVTHRTETYEFRVASDDGFRLWIDSAQIGEYVYNRPFKANVFTIRLQPGIHHYKLLYYQGYGNLGLEASFRKKRKHRFLWIGKNGDGIVFKQMK